MWILNRAAVALVCIFCLCTATSPAEVPRAVRGILSGVITDTSGSALAGVQVVIVEARRNTASDSAGRYRFLNLPDGTYAVTFRAIGYRPETRRVIVQGEAMLDVALTPARIEFAAIQVTATADAGGAARSPQPTTILSDERMRASQAPTLGATLDNMPGVRSSSTGQGIGKPVIRGLSNNRVLVLDDGMRLENAQWGDEHGPQVETLDADRIEVIRGPASVLYGSDALGGVVNVVPRELPDAIGRTPLFSGRASGGYASGSSLQDGGLLLEGAAGGFGVRGSVVGRRAGNVQTPAGPLFNSGLDAMNTSLSAGLRGSWGHVALDGVHRIDRIEIHEDPAEDPLATPRQRITEDRVRADAGLPVGSSRLELRAGWERNRRRELEAADEADTALVLTTTSGVADAHLHHASFHGWNGIVGLSLLRSSVTVGGEEALVPASRTTDIGILAFEQRDVGNLHVAVGIRFDIRTLDVDSNQQLAVSAQQREYRAIAGNFGVLTPLNNALTVVANIGRAWRAPSSFELFANGVHEGTVRFEIGDPTLNVESSWNLDAALRWQTSSARGEAGIFVNRVSNFIFASPTGATDSASGFQIFQHTQGDALLAGLEASILTHPWHALEASAELDYTHGQNTVTDRPLPQIPPFRASATLRFEPQIAAGMLRSPYVSATIVAVSNVPASRRDPNDLATGAYNLVHIGTGLQFLFGARLLSVDAGIRNVFDETYRDFLSRYKTYAVEMGRNVFVRLTATF